MSVFLNSRAGFPQHNYFNSPILFSMPVFLKVQCIKNIVYIFQVRYFTVPPEVEVHVESKIVSTFSKEFDINSFEAMETETINELATHDTGVEAIKV